MVLYSHLGLVGESYLETSSSNILESEISENYSSLTWFYGGGDEHSPSASSIYGMTWSSNCTFLSMKVFWVEESNILYPFLYLPYPTMMHSFLCACKYFLLSWGILAQTLEPKILKCEIFGLWPNQASYGVFPFIYLWRAMFLIYEAQLMASSHRLGLKSLASII